jgi:hypothetical protein
LFYKNTLNRSVILGLDPSIFLLIKEWEILGSSPSMTEGEGFQTGILGARAARPQASGTLASALED